MPSLPAFDYYKELQLDRTATIEDIKTSYRRLALIHHPDKNPESLVEATAAFQKIQTAYETLSEERSRAIYDARSSRSTARPSNGRSPFDSDDSFDVYDDEEDIGMTFEEFMHGGFGGARYQGFNSRGPGGFGSFFYDGNFGFYTRETSPEEIRKRREERQRADDAHLEYLRAKVRQRMEREEVLTKAREAAKLADEEQRMLKKEEREKEERKRNEMNWAKHGASTKDEKQALCFHSENWAKEKFQKKVKCEACGQKRGIVGHRCPHCALLTCQVCVNSFNELRKVP